jgi:SAM-dependent methyltransferase
MNFRMTRRMGRRRRISWAGLGMLVAALGILAAFASAQSGYEIYGERSTNERQPPEKVMDAVGVRPGMFIGEVGAGRGRYTVHLARRVGESGKIFANDINSRSLDYLRERCRRDGLGNVETILGEIDDPLFPDNSLDMVIMVLAYHHLADPTALFRNLVPSLKPGATVVVLDPDPVKDHDRGGRESTSEDEIREETEPAGFELVRTETFLERDNLFILRVKGR